MNFEIETLAEDTLVLRFGTRLDATVNAQVHAAAATLRAARPEFVLDIAPAYASLTLRFDALALGATTHAKGPPHTRLVKKLRMLLAGSESAANATSQSQAARPPVEIPVCYGGDCGPDLAELAAHARLTTEAVIARHAAGAYTVAMLGFAPGFPYLLGLEPALHMARRTTPRTRVPAGSVAIGGTQTGIYPRSLPGGWNLIGRTPLVLFDAARTRPSLLMPGDRVHFRAIGPDEFTALARQVP